MSENRSVVYVVFGSQTGNAKSISEEVAGTFTEQGLETKCCPLNEITNAELVEHAKVLIIVCSTTGNGDCPENANNWWRTVKIRSLDKNLFKGIPYAVLGLGDTNYDKFCFMGKSIDKRLSELSAERCLDLACADEATNLEETVEKWKTAVVAKVTEIAN